MVATRSECPNVAGSRASMAETAAVTNPSNRRSMFSYSSEFSMADRGLRGERRDELDRSIIVGQYLPIDGLSRRQARSHQALAVDELQHTHDLVAMRRHGNHEHRFRPVAELLVEAAVLAVTHVLRKQVHVRNDERLVRRRGIARRGSSGRSVR